MSERKLGPKLIGIILLGFTALNYFLAFLIKFLEFYNPGVSFSQDAVQEMVYYEDIWGIRILDLTLLIISLALIVLIGVRGIELKLKYNIICGSSALALLLMVFAILPFRLLYFNTVLNAEGFFMPLLIVVFLSLFNTGCYFIIVIIAKLKMRKM